MTGRMSRGALSLLPYFIIPGLSAVTPLLVYPMMTLRHGAAGFTAVAAGMAVGLTIAAVCELGWGVLGPQRVARSDPRTHQDLLRSSLATKGTALLIGIPLAVLLTAFVVHDHHISAMVTAAGCALTALTPNWYLIGLNRPLRILFTDTLPKIATNVAVAGALFLGAPLVIYGVGAIITSMIPLAGLMLLERRSLLPRRKDFVDGFGVIRSQGTLTIGRAVTVTYTSLPVALTTTFAPSSAALFAATDRILRMGLTVIAAIPSRFQSYLGVSDADLRRIRIRHALLVNAALGISAGVVFFFATPWAMEIFFTGTISSNISLNLVMAGIASLVCMSRGYGLCIVAKGLTHRTLWFTGTSAVVCLVLIMTLTPPLGALGTGLAILIGEAAGLIVQMVLVHRSVDHSEFEEN